LVLDFGLGFGAGFACFTDLDRRFILEGLLAGLGVDGAAGAGAGRVATLLRELLRGRAFSAIALMDLSEIAEAGGSSRTGNATFFSDLFLVKIPLNPPLDSLRESLVGFKGTRFFSL
jgi:hypothetical protein